jgi:lipopolysaccharide transport system permease protein
MVGSSPARTTISARPESVWQFLTPLHLARNLWQRRELIRQFTRREIEGRYRGSIFGMFWSLVNPLVLLLIYTFVFGIIFKARWGQAGSQSLGQFALVLFCGIATFNIFSECVNRSSHLIISVPNYVKKVVFPLEILPISVLGVALFHGLISLSIVLIANILINHTIHWTLVLLPLVALPLIFLSLGLNWLLASLGVFIRDINYVVSLITLVLFFSSAVLYPIENIPEPYRAIIRFNPLTSIVENFRNVILWGVHPSWRGLALWLLATGAVMMLGYAWFMKTKKAFADVV